MEPVCSKFRPCYMYFLQQNHTIASLQQILVAEFDNSTAEGLRKTESGEQLHVVEAGRMQRN